MRCCISCGAATWSMSSAGSAYRSLQHLAVQERKLSTGVYAISGRLLQREEHGYAAIEGSVCFASERL